MTFTIRFSGNVSLVKTVREDKELIRLMKECTKRGGIPIIITRYAGTPIRYKNKPAVVFQCYGLGDPKGVLITGISQNLWEKLDKN